MTPRTRLLVSLTILLIGLGALAVGLFSLVPVGGEPRSSLIGGPFSLTAQDGRSVSDKDVKGNPFLVFFGYTHCPDVCPTALFEISEIFKALGPNQKISALFITIDPERDTPAVLKEYLSSFDSRIIGLSGTPAQIESVEKAYRVYAKKVGTGADYSMDHTAIIYLMDKDGGFINALNLQRPQQETVRELKKYL